MLIGDEAREVFKTGLQKVHTAVAPTLGPAARTVALKRNGRTIVINDGVTIARKVWSEDPYEQMGIDLILGAAENAQSKSGDGTTTATVLANSIVQNYDYSRVSDFTELLEKDIEKVCEFLYNKKSVCNLEDVTNVATIAANNDSELGQLIHDVFKQIGKDGVITVEKSDTNQTTYNVTEGLEIDKGYLSHLMINDDSTGEAILKNPLVLLTDKEIKKFEDILPALKIADANSQPLLVICKEMEGSALSNILMNIVQKRIDCCVVRAPDWGHVQIELLRDMAAICGANPYLSTLDMDLRKVKKEDLGTLDRAVVNRYSTVLIGKPPNEEIYQKRLGDLNAMLEQVKDDWEKDKLRTRLGRLTGGVAVIKVGGMTETEITERKERLDDALNASRAALQDGIIAGGGFMLNLASKECDIKSEALKKALSDPMKIIARNAGQKINGQYERDIVDGYGYDAKNKRMIKDFLDLQHGIVDPVLVTMNSLRVAASIANLILSTEVIIAEKEQNGF